MLSETHFTAYVPSAPVLPVRVGCQEVDMSVLSSFPDSQQCRPHALLVGRPVSSFAVLVGSVSEKRASFRVASSFRISFESWFSVGHKCVWDEVLQPLHPTTTHALLGPFMDFPSRRV